MKPIKQTILEAGRGNALQACVASLLELSLEDVPNFLESPDYLESLNQWLSLRSQAFLKVDLTDGRLPYPAAAGLLCLLAGPSPRGTHRHVVLGRTLKNPAGGFEILHDPFPEAGNLAGPPQWAGFFLPLNPTP